MIQNCRLEILQTQTDRWRKMKRLAFFVFLFCSAYGQTCTPGTTTDNTYDGTYDFSLSIAGPQHCFIGYTCWIKFQSGLITGTRDYAFYNVVGFPEEVGITYDSIAASCCGGNRGWEPSNQYISIRYNSTTPGSWNVAFSITSKGLTKTVCRQITWMNIPSISQVPITK